MSPEKLVLIISIVLVSFFCATFIYRKLPKRLKAEKFADKWKEIQKRCSDKAQWRQAIIESDDLLDRAMKNKKISGNTMGERLVEAQKTFTENDTVWFAHKLRTALDAKPELQPKQDQVKKALFGYRQALKDIGALK